MWGCFKSALLGLAAVAVFGWSRYLLRRFRRAVARRTLPLAGFREGHSIWTPGVAAGEDVGRAQPRPDNDRRFRPLPGAKQLRQSPGDSARLAAAGLPQLETTDDLLKWLAADLAALVALANPAGRIRRDGGNYAEWTVAKKRGSSRRRGAAQAARRGGGRGATQGTVRRGVRVICSPKPRLKAVQRRILREILDRAAPHDAVHGFRRGRGIRTHAEPHVEQALVVNLDLRHFFEHIRYPAVVGVFRSLGYSLEVSRWLAMLCTHRPTLCETAPGEAALGEAVLGEAALREAVQGESAPRDTALCDTPLRESAARAAPPAAARTDARSDEQSNAPTAVLIRRPYRHAVQGAPTSPALANLAVMRLDRRLAGLARRFGATYTRYADDLTFSGGEPFKRGMKRFFPRVQQIIRDEGFQLHVGKMRFMRPGQRQSVTGVVVNQRLSAPRDECDRLKAIIHNAARHGLESQNREGRADLRAYLLGRAGHVALLNPERGRKLIDQIRALS